MKARTTHLKHPARLGAVDEQTRIATGFACGLGISAVLWTIGAAVVVLLV